MKGFLKALPVGIGLWAAGEDHWIKSASGQKSKTSGAMLWICFVLAAAIFGLTSSSSGETLRDKVQRLLGDLDHALEHKRLEAIYKLGEMGPDAMEALATIVRLLEQSENLSARIEAARAAARIAPESPEVRSALTKFLENVKVHYELRQKSARALGEMARSRPHLAPLIVPTLARALRLGQGNIVEVELAVALAGLDEKAQPAIRDLEHVLKASPFADVQIGKMGSHLGICCSPMST